MLSPWILLNLIFSGVAFYTGALVIIAQKAQTRTDANEEASAKHREELSNAQSALLEQNTELTKEIHEMAVKLRALTEQAARRRARPRARAATSPHTARPRTTSAAQTGASLV
jgi:uncharacterized membrane protein